MARDWRFRPASFRGATFYVDRGSPSGGRKKALHEYPGSDNWDVEDLGSRVKKVSITAYFVSETADTDYAALVAAMDQSTPGQLSIPFFPVVQASAETWEPSWSQEKLNYCGAEVTFFVENAAGAPVAIGLGERIIAGLLDGASGVIGAGVAALFAGLPSTSYQLSDAVSALSDGVALVQTIAQSVALPDDTASTAITALAALVASTAETDPGGFVTQVLTILDAVAIDATPDDAAMTLQTAATLAVLQVSPTLEPQPMASQAAASVPAAIAIATTMQAIRLTATSTYTDRPAAIAARTTIETMATQVLPFLGALGADVTDTFSDLWGQGVTYLSTVITNLAPVLLIQSNVSLPSTVLAYRYYGDPNRAAELVARNKVTTSLFMPTLFEAASR